MAQDRITLRSPAAIPRRPAAATTIQRSPVAVPPSPAQVLQRRLGIQGTQALIARMAPVAEVATGAASPVLPLPAERSPLISVPGPAQAQKSGVVPQKVGPQKEAPEKASAKVPGSKVSAKGPSSAAESPAATSKPAATGKPPAGPSAKQ